MWPPFSPPIYFLSPRLSHPFTVRRVGGHALDGGGGGSDGGGFIGDVYWKIYSNIFN